MKPQNRRLVTEKLENRELMAGDIGFANGVLTINMSADGWNQMTVSQHGAYVRVAGNATLTAYSPDRILARDVRELVVNGSNRADDIHLEHLRPDFWTSLKTVTVNAGAGDDRVVGSVLADCIYGGADNDRIDGFLGNDWLYGQQGDDTITGGAGSDHIYGGKGDDRLIGGPWHGDDLDPDYIFGGGGIDTYGLRNRHIGKNDVLVSIELDLRTTV